MRRRDFIALAGSAALAWPGAARAQQPPRRIAFLHSGVPVAEQTEASRTFWIAAFFRELRRLGLVEGSNLVIERYSAGGSADRNAALAAEIVATKPDVVISNAAAPLKGVITAIPLVAIMGDPIASGLVTSLARPGGNLTGVTIDGGPGLIARRLQLLREAVPTATQIVGLVGTLAEEGRTKEVLATKLLTTVDEASLARAFAEMIADKIDAVIMGEQGSFLARRTSIVALAAQHQLPIIYSYRDYAEAGGLLAYGPDLGELARRMASDVQVILGGTKPGDIPIFQPTKFELVINLKTAMSLGLTIPQTVLAQADEVIE